MSHVKRIVAFVDAHPGRSSAVMCDGNWDAAATGADVETTGFKLAPWRDPADTSVNKDLRLRSRYQNRRSYGKLESEEVCVPKNVLQGLALASTRDEATELLELVLGERTIMLHVEIKSRNPKNGAQQQVDRQPRRINSFGLEIFLTPCNEITNGPDTFDFRRWTPHNAPATTPT
jgi:hypothetical protein